MALRIHARFRQDRLNVQSSCKLFAFCASVVCLLLMVMLDGCGQDPVNVVAYVSVDRNIAKPILDAFAARTGIKVRAAYDSEANKTVGLVNRLITERAAPRADVFWSGEPARTIELCSRGVLARFANPSVLENERDDPRACWRAFAGRIRVLLVRKGQPRQRLLGLEDFTHPRWRGRACMADPHFGSTGTHFAALYVSWGEDKFRSWLKRVRANDVAILPGNAQVKEAIMQGSCALGLTDSDDAQAALLEHAPVEIVIPDQGGGGGTFLFESTVSLVQGAPHSQQAAKLIEFLLTPEVEAVLARSRAGFLPIRHSLAGPSLLPPRESLVVMNVAANKISKAFPDMLRAVGKEWRPPR